MNSLINKFIDNSKEAIIEDVKSLIEIPSISLMKKDVDEALNWVINKANEFGLKSYTVLDNRVGVVEMGDGEETIGILTHVDVVEAEELELWNTNPFKAEIIEGSIYGRGAVDDKGPLISCLYAMKALKEAGKPLKKKIQMIIGTQEETEWSEIDTYVKNYRLPDYSFTPDGEFPITNIEKGYLDVILSFRNNDLQGCDKGINVVSIFGGKAVNVIPAKCEVELRGEVELIEKAVDNFNLNKGKKVLSLRKEENKIIVTATGSSCHSCFPDKGVNANVIVSNFLKELPLEGSTTNRITEFLSKYFTETGDLNTFGLKAGSEYLNGEFIHKTVASPTILKVKGESNSLTLNFRTAYGTTIDEIRKCFEKHKEAYSYDFEFSEPMEATYVSKECRFLHALGDSYEKNSGFQNEFVLAYGASYAKAMPKTVAFGPIFPGEEDCCHEANEFITIENLMKITKIYANALSTMAFSEESFK